MPFGLIQPLLRALMSMRPRTFAAMKGLAAMSFQECTQRLRNEGTLRINAAEFSMDELEAAAALAQTRHARLIIDNLKGRSCADVGRIADAGGRQVTFGDIYLI